MTTPILAEYHEKISEKTAPFVADNILKLLLSLPNVRRVNVHFNWHLIEADEDDNAFADCAIAGNADYIVSEDRHFNILSSVEFPKLYAIKIHDLKELINA